MIIDYDHNQNLNTDRKLDSLKESVQMALNETASIINSLKEIGSADVSVVQKTSTGTNIADITVDGVTTQLYAPNGGGGSGVTDVEVNGTSVVSGGIASVTVPTDTSDLTNGAGYMDASAILNMFYPVGSYYETSDSTFDPNVSWGGTWLLETEGIVHISGSDNGTYQISGATTDTQDGGNKDAIIPYHNHTASGGAVSDKASFSTNSSGAVTDGITGGSHHHTIGSAWSSGSGSQTAYTMSSNRTRQTLNSGDSTHKHNLPNHTHTIPSHGHGFTQPTISYAGTSGNTTDANMQPYIIVNRWHRTA